MRFLIALICGFLVSFLITPIGGIILFFIILFTGRSKPQNISQNVYINGVPENNYSARPDRIVSKEEIDAKLENDRKSNILRELDILNKKYKRNLISYDEYQERVKKLSS